MKPLKVNNILLDLEKISYIGNLDKHIRYGVINSVSHFFIVVVDGYAIEIQDEIKDNLNNTRENLIISWKSVS